MRDRLVYVATAIAASVLGLAAMRLVIDEKEFGDTAFLDIQIWVLQLILPIAFFMISYRSLLNFLLLPKPRTIAWEDHGEPRAGDGGSTETE